MQRPLPYKAIAITSWLAALCCYLVIYFALKAVNFNPDAMVDPLNQIGVGEAGAHAIGWSMIFDMYGFYMLSTPAALFLWFQLKDEFPYTAAVSTVAALAYILTGTLGAGILSVVWPDLMVAYAKAGDEATKQSIQLVFRTVTETVYTGLWGRAEYVMCGVWWLGVGWMMKDRKHLFALWSGIAGLASLAGAMGETINDKTLADAGMNIYLLVVPIWTAWVGKHAWSAHRKSH